MLPSTPMLDNFSRPDENPLSNNGAWIQADPGMAGTLRVLNNELQTVSVPACYAWDRGDDVLNCEAFIQFTNTNAGEMRLLARMLNIGVSADLYCLYVSCDPNANVVITGRLDSSTNQVTSTTSFVFQLGDVLLGSFVANVVTAYVIRGSTVHQIASATVPRTHLSYNQAGKLGILRTGNVNSRWRNFGGGEIDSLAAPARPIAGLGAA